MEETYLFVYGTLRKGFSLVIPEKIADDIEWVGLSQVCGELYDIGNYPGAVPDVTETWLISGEIIRIKSPVKVFEYLDNYEGYDDEKPESSEYFRKKEWFKMEDDTNIEAWIYWYNFDVSDKERIRENDYITYLQKNQLA
jgi:gamma-glutamylcyclotransferase (GGCT)/AIG2-like uncharacterized protein YtfP